MRGDELLDCLLPVEVQGRFLISSFHESGIGKSGIGNRRTHLARHSRRRSQVQDIPVEGGLG